MTPKLKRMSSREIVKRLKSEGWIEVDGEGSHRNFKNPDITGKITVPHPKKDFPAKTLRSIYKMAGWL